MSRTELTNVERVFLRHLVEDHGAEFYGPVGLFTFRFDDAVRYTAEGYVEKVFLDVDRATLWELVRVVLRTQPEILQRGRLSDDDRRANARRRQQAAAVHEEAARVAFQAGELDEALARIDQAELQAPCREGMYSWNDLRGFVRERAEARGRQTGTTPVG